MLSPGRQLGLVIHESHDLASLGQHDFQMKALNEGL